MTETPDWWEPALRELSAKLSAIKPRESPEEAERRKLVAAEMQRVQRLAREQREKEIAALAATLNKRWQAVRDKAEIPVIVELVDWHKPNVNSPHPDHNYCDGCESEVSGYEYDMEPWPCATFTIIESSLTGAANPPEQQR